MQIPKHEYLETQGYFSTIWYEDLRLHQRLVSKSTSHNCIICRWIEIWFEVLFELRRTEEGSFKQLIKI